MNPQIIKDFLTWVLEHLPKITSVYMAVAVIFVMMLWGLLWHFFGFWMFTFILVGLGVVGYTVVAGGNQKE
jgi:hypothetical protein